jgi:hypothetical protein
MGKEEEEEANRGTLDEAGLNLGTGVAKTIGIADANAIG